MQICPWGYEHIFVAPWTYVRESMNICSFLEYKSGSLHIILILNRYSFLFQRYLVQCQLGSLGIYLLCRLSVADGTITDVDVVNTVQP